MILFRFRTITLVTSASFLKSYVCSEVTYIFRAIEAKLQTATCGKKHKLSCQPTPHAKYTLSQSQSMLSIQTIQKQRTKQETKMEKYTPHFYAFLQAEKRITTIEKDLVDINITIKIQFSVLVSPAACKLPFQNSGLTTSCGIKISN